MREKLDDFRQNIDKKARNIIISELRLTKGSLPVAAHNLGVPEELLRHYLDHYKIFPDDYGPRKE